MTSRPPLRVLVVEDEWIVADIIAVALEAAGFVVVGPVGRIRQAAVLVETEAIDAAFVDVNLHGERSYGLAEQLAGASIPFAFLSGYSQADLPQDLKSRPLMQKPVDAAALLRCIGMLLGGRSVEKGGDRPLPARP